MGWWEPQSSMKTSLNKWATVTKNVGKGIYKTKSGKMIEENKTVKDLGILTSEDVFFADQLDDLVLLSNVKAGLLLWSFITKEAETMMKMINWFIRSKLDYCCLILNPVKKRVLIK